MKNFMAHNFDIKKIDIACFVPAGSGATIHNNRPCHGLAFFLDGEKTFIFKDGTRIHIKGNAIVYFPKGSSYIVQDKEKSPCYAINFNLNDNVSFSPFAFYSGNFDFFLERFKSCQKRWTKREHGYLMKVMSNLYDIIYNMQREYSNQNINGAFSKIKPAVDYIHSNYLSENISISHLADLCNISEVYLRSLFLKRYNLSPNKYIKSLKLKRAEELLSSGLYNVNEVCFLAGFSDESFFSREFKKHLGVTPGEYMNASR